MAERAVGFVKEFSAIFCSLGMDGKGVVMVREIDFQGSSYYSFFGGRVCEARIGR